VRVFQSEVLRCVLEREEQEVIKGGRKLHETGASSFVHNSYWGDLNRELEMGGARST
jgi:hypothetical protein